MPKIAEEDLIYCGGASQKIQRLGLVPLFAELKEILVGFPLLVEERKDRNGGKTLRKMIDHRFEAKGGWIKKVSGDIDWTKCHVINGTRACIGVEIQMSARSDLVVVDLIHLRRGFTTGLIDIGVLVVPNDKLGPFLTDRVAQIKDAKRHIKVAKIEDLPIVVIGIEHDGPGPALPKQAKSTRKRQAPKRDVRRD